MLSCVVGVPDLSRLLADLHLLKVGRLWLFVQMYSIKMGTNSCYHIEVVLKEDT